MAAPGRTGRHPRGAGAESAYIAEGLRPLAVPIATLLPDPANVRRHSDRNIEAIKGSLQRYGQRRPVVVNRRTGTIEAGNATWEAARALGWAHLAVVYVEDDPTTAAGFSIADNRTGELADWDDESLARTLEALKTEGELPNVGFDDRDLDRLLRSLRPPREEIFSVAQAMAASSELSTKVQRGEIWHLGASRVMCGDSTNPDDVRRLMGDTRAALFVTDPPYLVDYTGNDRPNNSGKDWSSVYREVDIRKAAEFFSAAFENALEALQDNAPWYVWHAHKRISLIEAVWERLGILNHQQIIWTKPVAMHGHAYWPWQHEPCLFGWKRGHRPPHDGNNSHEWTSVWAVDYDGKRMQTDNDHPTQKPVELYRRPIHKHTAPDDPVLDLFLGSGTAVIACEQTGRRAFGMEIEPLFCSLTIARWEAYTGQTAVLDA